ncbi:hypothetical protein ACMGE9_05105 [Macrococcus sp. EM39E]|uniref:hypothetical protein n=1 Tax=Macrococcus animalis TaxID=3395467 RepID=UPI0039BE097E
MSIRRSIIKNTLKRKSILGLLLLGCLPLLYIIITMIDPDIIALDGVANMTFLDFYMLMLGLQNSMLISTVIMGFIISAIYYSEKEHKVLAFYKDIKRSKIFNAKLISMSILFMSYHLIYFISNVIVYYTKIQYLKIATADFAAEDVWPQIIIIIGALGLHAIAFMIGIMCATFMKTGASIAVMVVFQLIGLFGYKMEGLKYLLPNSYDHLLKDESEALVVTIIITIIVVYWLITYFIGRYLYRHLEY